MRISLCDHFDIFIIFSSWIYLVILIFHRFAIFEGKKSGWFFFGNPNKKNDAALTSARAERLRRRWARRRRAATFRDACVSASGAPHREVGVGDGATDFTSPEHRRRPADVEEASARRRQIRHPRVVPAPDLRRGVREVDGGASQGQRSDPGAAKRRGSVAVAAETSGAARERGGREGMHGRFCRNILRFDTIYG